MSAGPPGPYRKETSHPLRSHSRNGRARRTLVHSQDCRSCGASRGFHRAQVIRSQTSWQSVPPNSKTSVPQEVNSACRVALGPLDTPTGARLCEPQHVGRGSRVGRSKDSARAELLRVADSRSGARLCEPQQRRRRRTSWRDRKTDGERNCCGSQLVLRLGSDFVHNLGFTRHSLLLTLAYRRIYYHRVSIPSQRSVRLLDLSQTRSILQ